jgi:hypothetical protein
MREALERRRFMCSLRNLGLYAAAFAIAAVSLLAGPLAGPLAAQPAPAAAAQPAPGTAPTRLAPNSAAGHAATAQNSAQPGTRGQPAAAAMPDWPANDRPSSAAVTWDSHGLSIVAANSSLTQILHQVSTETGATLEGLTKDERIFGIYGPGPARDVISQLLDGSGYNVMMVGDVGMGTPRQIVLLPRTEGAAQQPHANTPTAEEEEPEPEPQAEQPEPPPPPPQQQPPANPTGGPAVPVRSQQELIQQLQQQRQQQMQQQQQQNPQ